jgi:hypothetical protein
VDDEGNKMIEFHIDAIADEKFNAIHCLIRDAEMKTNGLGANQSWFRTDKLRKPLVMIGQDECIFKQFLMTKKAWQSKDGRF